MNVEKISDLVTALLQPMPDGFEWNWDVIAEIRSDGIARGCAVGLAAFLGIIPESVPEANVSDLQRHLGLDTTQAAHCFLKASDGGDRPEVIATRLAAILAGA